MGIIPTYKEPDRVDAKLIAQYDIGISDNTRRRRKKLGFATVQYLRYDRIFVIIATEGEHHFRRNESGAVRDIRKIPIKFNGYSISYKQGGMTRDGEKDAKWHSHVQIERSRYKEIRADLVNLAKHRSAAALAMEFYRLPFEPYAPIRRQMFNLLRAVNRVRKTAGFAPLPYQVLPLRRRIVKPFEPKARAAFELENEVRT